MRFVNRSGNRPSYDGAAAQCDFMATELRAADFRSIVLKFEK